MPSRPRVQALAALMIGAALLTSMPASAQETAQSPAAIAAMIAQSGADEAKPKESAFPDFKEVTKDMESQAGMFTLWYYPSSASDKDSEKLLCQIPSSFLGEKFMLSTSFSGGGFFTGFPLDERVVKWTRLDKQLVLVEPETRYVVNKSADVADVVNRTYPEQIRVAVPIVTQAPNGDPVIDLGSLLKSDFADIGWMSGIFGQRMSGGGINPSLSKWTARKTFELNVEIGVELAMSQSSPPGSYQKKMVHYSFWKLPESDYQPRIADDRVGYFLTANQDWAKPTSARDLFNRYIDRWHLVKRDPKLRLCEPREPIVFYIEKTVPVRFRRAVRDGILEWNKAFEKLGFVNAVEVRQQTADNEWKDYDPEDMRYSFFRWIVTGAGFAMGPHRSNPFTGQIYDADIIFDDSMVRYFEQSAHVQLPAAWMQLKMRDPVLEKFLESNPQWKRPTRDWEQQLLGDPGEAEVREAIRHRMAARGHHLCEYSEGMKHQMALAHTMLVDKPKEVIDQFLYEVIKEVVMHEVGHTLGLRHNFKASSIYDLDEIRRRRTTGEATVGSVMDYNPVLFFAEKATEGHFITTTIGPYDYWAIEYGYRPFDESYQSPPTTDEGGKKNGEPEAPKEEKDAQVTAAAAEGDSAVDIPKEVWDKLPEEARKMLKSGNFEAARAAKTGEPAKPAKPSFKTPPQGEEKMLLEIASRGTDPELAYATDEDTTFLSPDPRSNRFDMGSSPVEWARTRMELVDQRMATIKDWAVKDQESWYHLRRAFLSLWTEKVFVMDYVGRYIGGQYFHRHHMGDPNAAPPFVVVEPSVQREALAFIEEHLYSDSFFSVSPDLLNHLAPARWWHTGVSVDFMMDFPVRDMIAMMQWWNLFDRLFPNTLRRIHDNELRTNAPDRLTAAEYIRSMERGCWANALDAKRAADGEWTDTAPFISDVRRSLQREYLGVVEPLVRTQPGRVISPDLHAMIRHSLEDASTQMAAVLDTKKLDFASTAHLESCRSRIERMLKSELREY